MTDIRTLIIGAIVAFVLGASLSGGLVWKYEENRWGAAAAKQEKEAAKQLALETEKVRQADLRYGSFKTQVEKDDGIKKAQVESLLRDNRRLARELGGLRDPGRRPRSDGTVPSTQGTASQCASGTAEGRLSDEASEFLLEFAAEADRAATYAQTCHAWAVGKDISGDSDSSASP